MKTKILISFLTLIVSAILTAEEPGLAGDWKTDKGTIRITNENGTYRGTSLEEDANSDLKGNDPMKDIVPSGSGWKGSFYVPPLGNYAKMTCELEDPSTLKVTVKAGLITKTVVWTRMEAE